VMELTVIEILREFELSCDEIMRPRQSRG
jgi:hypothetical protein